MHGMWSDDINLKFPTEAAWLEVAPIDPDPEMWALDVVGEKDGFFYVNVRSRGDEVPAEWLPYVTPTNESGNVFFQSNQPKG